jgi:site-specific recombinase XerD
LFVREIEHWRWKEGGRVHFRSRTTPPVRTLDGLPDQSTLPEAPEVPEAPGPKIAALDSDESNRRSKIAPAYQAVEAMQSTLRGGHYSLNTEASYLSWVKRYLTFCGGEEKARTLGSQGAKAFLEELACRGKVTASTQNQGFSALLFLYRHVCKLSLEGMETTLRARRSKKLPTVLSNAEVAEVLQRVGHGDGAGLLVHLLYGCGLRLREGLHLRLKDIDLQRSVIEVRDAKGKKDRMVTLPRALEAIIEARIKALRCLWQMDRECGLPGATCRMR